MSKPYDLHRFLSAQDGIYPTAHAEIAAGHKQTHWMWFIFPQLRGLGRSPKAQFYGIDGLGEAVAYLANPTLGSRLIEMYDLLIARHPDADPRDIFGDTDAVKLRSSATLFGQVPDAPGIFERVLHTYYDAPCRATLDRL